MRISALAEHRSHRIARREVGRDAQLDLRVVGDDEGHARRRPEAGAYARSHVWTGNLLEVGVGARKTPRVGGQRMQPAVNAPLVHVVARPSGVGRDELVQPRLAIGLGGGGLLGDPRVGNALEGLGIDPDAGPLHVHHRRYQMALEIVDPGQVAAPQHRGQGAHQGHEHRGRGGGHERLVGPGERQVRLLEGPGAVEASHDTLAQSGGTTTCSFGEQHRGDLRAAEASGHR